MKKISTKILLDHPRVKVVEDDIILPNGKESKYLRFIHRKNTAMVIAERADGKIAVGKELSYPTGKRLYQFPGGGCEQGESLKVAARREFEEETGYKLSIPRKIGEYYLDNRRSDMKLSVYVGTAKKSNSQLIGDEFDLEVEWLTSKEIDAFIANGRVENPTMLAGWAIFKARKVDIELFRE